MKFSDLQINAFCEASYDRNPLHIDPEYARRTQFGRPVVYGMAAVLYGLGQWANWRSFRLLHLRAIFRKPLFVGESYELQIDAQDGLVNIKFRRGPVDYAIIHCGVELLSEMPMEVGQLYRPFLPIQTANVRPLDHAQEITYCMNTGAWDALQAAFQLNAHSMPPHQLATLLWASYHVGMALPGQQALFSELQVSFDSQDLRSAQIHLDLATAEFDERFNRYIVQGQGSGISSLRIAAFRRPLPVDFPLEQMPDFANGAQPLADKVVFISGAMRGFGAAMARMCAKAGARLALNYRGDAAAAEELLTELRRAGTEAIGYAADLIDAAATAAMAQAISHDFGQLDFIVNNAAPPIRDAQFLEQSNADFLAFVQQNLSITLETARHLLPILRPQGQFVHISTKYLVTPVRGFAHYLSAKAAQEALMEGLSLEFRDNAFLIARLPRILTDQTNLAFDFDPPLHPGTVAMSLIETMTAGEFEHFRAVNLFDQEEDEAAAV
jgi:NAD(P)-dependent dehydrogenase (short-subunit alcohol dehydrogenase family)